jgi:antitoxin component YwqK of YwqJK toxin-antitoxin module
MATDDDEELEPYTKLHKDGSLWATGQLLGSEMHGYWEWYRLDGTVMRSGSFDRGQQIGEWITYDSLGRPHKITNFADAD